jgi:hypothetical protein
MLMLTDADADREWRLVWGDLLLLTAAFTLILVVELIYSAW